MLSVTVPGAIDMYFTALERFGTTTFAEAAKLAKKAEVQELWLTHYSPANPEPEQFEAELKAIFANTVIAKDGQTATLQFQD